MSEYKRPRFFEAPLGYIIAPVILYLLFFYLSGQMRLVLLASVIGALLGCFTGLVPGIHANTIAILLYSLTVAIEQSLGFLSDTMDVKILIVVAIASTSITHTFLNFIPGTVLGAPEENNALGVLPMHEMILRKKIYRCKKCSWIYDPRKFNNEDLSPEINCGGCGNNGLQNWEVAEEAPGYLAIYYSAIGSLYAAIFCIMLIIPLKLLFGRESLAEERGYDVAREYMLWILLGITLILILTDNARLKKYTYSIWKNGERKDVKKTAWGLKERPVLNKIKNKEGTEILNNLSFATTSEGIWIDEIKDYGFLGRIAGIMTSISIFLLSGLFGWIVLNHIEGTADSPFNPFLRENYGFYLPPTTLFPAFTGLFGIATLLYSSQYTTPKYSEQNLGVRNPKFKNLIDLEKNIIYADFSDQRLGGFRDKIFSWFTIRKVPPFYCAKCNLYYNEKNKPKLGCKCSEGEIDYKSESINYSNSMIGASLGAMAGLLPGVTAGIGTILAMFFKNVVNEISIICNSFAKNYLGIKKQIQVSQNNYSEDNEFSGRSEDVIMTLAAVNTAASLTILAGLFIILRPRNGTTIVIDQMITVNEWIEVEQMPLVLTCLLISVLVSIVIGFVFTATTGVKAIDILMDLREYDAEFAPKAMKFMIVALSILVWFFTGIVGLIVLFIGAIVGLLPQTFGVRRSLAMGFLLLPVMIFYYNMSGSGLFS